MTIIVCDIETYYDKDYSITKSSTEAYIRDPRFETILVSVKVDGQPTEWHSGDKRSTQQFLNQFPWSDATLIAHNTPFDGFILNHHFNIRPKFYSDTLAMGTVLHGLTHSVSLKSLSALYGVGEKGDEVVRAIGKHRIDFNAEELEQYAIYCMGDTNLTYKLARKMAPLLPQVEHHLIHLTSKMYCQPQLILDEKLLTEHLKEVIYNKENLLLRAMDAFTAEELKDIDDPIPGIKKLLMSNDKFAAVLRHVGIDPPMKISPTTGKPAFAFAKTDEQFKELGESDNEIVQTLVAARLGNKSTIDETRTEKFIGIAHRGTFPFPVRYSGARVTHRWSGTDGINPQNLNRVDRKKPKPSDALRLSVMAPPGYTLVAGDLSNIELRLGLWLAGEYEDLDALRNGKDLYRKSAEDIEGTPYAEVSDELRFIFKTVNLAGIFGVGHAKMHRTLRQGNVIKELTEVHSIVKKYRDKHKNLVDTWYEGERVLEAIYNNQHRRFGQNGGLVAEGSKGIRKPSGLYLPYPGICKRAIDNQEGWVYFKQEGRSQIAEKIYGAKVFQRCVQSMARDLIGWQMVQFAQEYPIVGTVHDEVISMVLDKDVDDCKKVMEQCMTTGPEWAKNLPLACDIGAGKRYGEC